MQPRNTYNHTYIKVWLDKTKYRQNNLFITDSAEYKINLDIKINNIALPMTTHPKVLSLTLYPKLTYSTHIHNISVQAHKPLQMIKVLTATGWGKQKETLMVTYKAVMRPALEYASSIWSHVASSTSIKKRKVMQNAALRTATGWTQDTNIQHLHDKTLILPIHEHIQLHASQYKQKTQHPSYPLHKHTTYFNTPRLKTPTIFNNGRYTTNFPTDPYTVTTTDIKTNMRHIHTSIVSMHLATKYCAHLDHTFVALKRHFLASLIAPLPNSEQINHPSSNHIYTKSTTNHIHHHYAPSVTLTHTTHIISSTAPTYVPHCHPWICGQTPLARVMGVGRQQHKY